MDLLFLAHRAPFPPDRGDKIRSYHVLRHLAARARVHLIAFGETPADQVPPPALAATLASWTVVPRGGSRGMAALRALATGRPVSLAAFDSAAFRKAVDAVLARHPVAATYVFSGQMAQYLSPAHPRTIMDFVDVDSAKFAELGTRGPPALRWLMRREARLLGAFERQVAARVEASLFVSDAEAALFRRGGATGTIRTVENGIDADAFDPATTRPVDEAGPLLVFTGQMDYRPNIDAVVRFARDILPAIPDTRFAIVGRAPSAEVRALASDRVIVTGEVADTRPWLAAASVCVAPLLLARGIQNKVLEAMAMARPVVASTAAAEGIDHGGSVRVADDPADVAAAIATLLDDPAAARTLGEAARARVLTRYAWPAALAPLDGLIGL